MLEPDYIKIKIKLVFVIFINLSPLYLTRTLVMLVVVKAFNIVHMLLCVYY